MILKEMRIRKGFSARFVSSFLGVKQNTYSQYENAKRFPPIPILLNIQRLYKLNDSECLSLIDTLYEEARNEQRNIKEKN